MDTDRRFKGLLNAILAIANKKKIPGCYISRCYVGSCGGNIVSGARAGVTSEAWMYMYVYLNWFTFIIVRPVQWQPRKNDPFGLLITIKCELETWERCKRYNQTEKMWYWYLHDLR